MSYNKGARANQSTGNIPQKPFMYGGYSSSSTTVKPRCPAPESVRDCMHWPLSLESDSKSKSHSQSQGDRVQPQAWTNTTSEQAAAYVSANPNGGSTFNFPAPQDPMNQPGSIPANYPKAKAFMQGGKGELHPLSIPCQLAPSGSPIQPMASMQPMTIKVTAPSGVPRNGQPMNFQINPYAGLQTQQVQRRT